MGQLNRVMLIGTVKGWPEMEELPSGDKMATFSLRTLLPTRPRGEVLIPIVSFGRATTYAETLNPEQQVYVEGYLRPSKGSGWEVRAGQILAV